MVDSFELKLIREIGVGERDALVKKIRKIYLDNGLGVMKIYDRGRAKVYDRERKPLFEGETLIIKVGKRRYFKFIAKNND